MSIAQTTKINSVSNVPFVKVKAEKNCGSNEIQSNSNHSPMILINILQNVIIFIRLNLISLILLPLIYDFNRVIFDHISTRKDDFVCSLRSSRVAAGVIFFELVKLTIALNSTVHRLVSKGNKAHHSQEL